MKHYLMLDLKQAPVERQRAQNKHFQPGSNYFHILHHTFSDYTFVLFVGSENEKAIYAFSILYTKYHLLI